MNESLQTEDLTKRLTRYVDIVGSLNFDNAVAASYLLSCRRPFGWSGSFF